MDEKSRSFCPQLDNAALKNFPSHPSLALLFLLLVGCHKAQQDLPKSPSQAFAGTYECIQDHGTDVLGKNWGKRYWELKSEDIAYTLSFYDDARGIDGFELDVEVIEQGSELRVYYQATRYTAYLAPIELERLEKGDFLASFHTSGNDLITSSQFLYITDSTQVERLLFQKTTSSTPNESDRL